MSDLLARLAALFVEPAPSRPVQRVSVAAPAPCVGVLASARHAHAVAATVALALGRSSRAHYSLLCTWPTPNSARPTLAVPAHPGARRLRRNLDARGVEATAAGRLVRVALPAEPERAVATAERVVGTAAAPAVVAIAGPRPDALDDFLLRQDAIVVAADSDADNSVVDLAVTALANRHPTVASCAVPLGPVSRVLASAGVVAALGAARPLAPILEAVG
jgi:hypothetical protein